MALMVHIISGGGGEDMKNASLIFKIFLELTNYFSSSSLAFPNPNNLKLRLRFLNGIPSELKCTVPFVLPELFAWNVKMV